MYVFSKIAWEDGMFIYPQHFQQQEIYFEKLISKFHIFSPIFGFGLLEFEIDEDALLLNKIVIRKSIGILPDGTLFSAPNKDPLPLPINVPVGYNNDFVYLGISLGNFSKDKLEDERHPNTQCRYFSKSHEFSDVNSNQLESREIKISCLNLNLFLSSDDLSNITFIPILKVHNTLNGIYLDKEYIPPVLRVHSSPILDSYVTKVIALLHHYINANLRFLGNTSVTQYIKKVENLLIFQTVYKYKQLFLLFAKDPNLLPYKLFETLLELLSSVSIFIENSRLEEILICYEHNNLSKSFSPLIELIEQTFAVLNKQTAIKLDFIYRNNLYIIDIPADTILKNTDFIISIELKDKNPNTFNILDKIKISTVDGIKNIISAQVAGAKCQGMKSVPPYVSYIENAIYGQILQEGLNWEQILSKRNVAIYASSDIGEIKNLALWIISK